MRNFYRISFICVALWLFLIPGANPIRASETAQPEVRALWVDAFRDGAKTPAQIDRLVQDALEANINTLIVQVRRRGDAYYNHSIEPRTEDPVLPAGFDALQYLIEKAHANKIEVHAWLNTLVAWNRKVPPQDPNHVWNLHGPGAAGRADWVSYSRTYQKATSSWSDTLSPSYYLDPGNPDAADYTVAVYLNVVKNYNVDGIHLDYSRYAGTGWGYNPTSVERYNARYGAKGLPDPGDPQWAQWRREQTANLVRKIYLEATALKPNLKVSSAVITWGDGPVAPGDWEKSRAYQQVYQDWQAWLAEGILDLAIPMNYFNEWNPTQQLWYNHWIEWEKDHQYGRQIVIGPGIFSQYIENSLDQIRQAEAPSAQGNRVAGVALYAYGWSNVYSNDDYQDPEAAKQLPRQPHAFLAETNGWIFHLLTNRGVFTDPVLHTDIATEPVFAEPVAPPDMPWKSHPQVGSLMGTVSGTAAGTSDHLMITVEAVNTPKFWLHRETYTDGSGWFGMTELPPGDYKVRVGSDAGKAQIVSIQAGHVTEANMQ